MKKKLILKDSVMNIIMDVNLVLFAIFLLSKGVLLGIPTLIVSILSLFIIILFGDVNNG